jgi:hypothetical protein
MSPRTQLVLLVLVVAVVVVGCASAPIGPVPSAEETERAARIAWDTLSSAQGIAPPVGPPAVTWREWDCTDANGTRGITHPDGSCIWGWADHHSVNLLWYGSIAGSELVHEFEHMWLEAVHGTADPRHQRDEWSTIVPAVRVEVARLLP